MLFKTLTTPFPSDYLDRILNEFSEAVLLVVNGNQAPSRFVLHALRDLAKLEARPLRLTEIAYEWCSAIYANRGNFEDWEGLLLVCLELGFRHLDAWQSYTPVWLTHTEHHRALADVVFKNQNSEVIADFLHSLTTRHSFPDHAGDMVGVCTSNLVDRHNLVSFSPRLRRLVILFIENVGYKGFKSAGVEKLIELLDHLRVTVEEMNRMYRWMSLSLGVIQSPGGTQRLSDWYWELLVELVVLDSWSPDFGDTDTLNIAKSLIDAQEWGRLECWIGILWMCSESGEIMEEGLEHSTLLLFRQRPGAAQRLEHWMEQWSKQHSSNRVPESLQQILTRVHETVQRQVVP